MILVLLVRVPLILYLRLVAGQVNLVETTRKFLWERDKYWQARLFTVTHGLNSINNGMQSTEEDIVIV